jgi:outer membrane protein assembly factor BamB
MQRYRRLSVLCSISVVFVAAAWMSAADSRLPDWSQWRGPRRDGVSLETGLLKEWPKDGPHLAWEVKGLGKGYSSVVISGGRIYTLGDRDGGCYLLALDVSNGAEVWSAKIGKPWGDGGPRCTPTVDGDRVYAVTPEGDLSCVSSDNGKVLWTKNFGEHFGGHMMSSWGYCESPFVDGDKLIVTPGGKTATLAALNKKTGAVVWKCPIKEGDGAGYASVVVAEVGGIRQYVQLLGRGIVGVAAKDGKFLWRYNRVANGTANIPTPIVRGDLVFCSTAYNTGSALLRLKPDGAGIKAEEVYFLPHRELQNHHGGMVLIGDHVYCGHGHNQGSPACVDLQTGKIVWKEDRGAGTGSAAVVAADNNLYFRYQNGVMALIEATPEAYHQKGTFKIPHAGGAPSWSHPVVLGGKLYLREMDWLMCFDVKQ